MSDWKLPETYNSKGLVNQVDSCNSSQASLISQSGLDASIDSSFEKTLPTLFVATAKGLTPSFVTDMFSSSFKSSKHLTQFLTCIFSYGLKIGDLETCLLLAKQFNRHKSYSKAVVYAVDNLTKTTVSVSMIDNLGMLIIEIFELLAKTMSSGINILVHVMVDTLVKWVSPSQDKKREITMAMNAKKIISKKGSDIGQLSASGYKLVYSQVRAGLVGDLLSAETRAVLLDTLVIMSRHVSKGEAIRFLVDDHLENENFKGLPEENQKIEEECDHGEDLPVGNEVTGIQHIEVFCEEKSEDTLASQNRPNVNRCDLEMMNQKAMPVSKEKSMLYDAGFVCTFSADVENIKAALEKKQDDEVGSGDKNKQVLELISPAMFEKDVSQEPAILKVRDPNALGHFVSLDTGISYSVFDKSTIGRDTSCSIMVPGKEVSRLHARVLSSQGKISIVTMSKTNKVRINGSTVDKEAVLMDGDRVQIGREVFTWQMEGNRPCDVSKDTLWGEMELSDNYIDTEKLKVNLEGIKEMVLNNNQEHVEDEGEVFSDADSVVVEMVNFIK